MMFLSVMGLVLFVKLERLMFDWMFLSSKLKAFYRFGVVKRVGCLMGLF